MRTSFMTGVILIMLFTLTGCNTLSVTAVHGTVVKSPDQTMYRSGEPVTLTAIADSDYTFAYWSGDITGTANPITVTMDTDKSVMANFMPNSAGTYTLTIIAAHGAVTKSPNKTIYSPGETVTLTAIADSGYTFVSWSGDAMGTINPVTITMNADKSITANFTATTASYTLTTTAVNGSVTKSPDKTGYSPGQVVTLTAVPSTGYAFSGWTGSISGTANPISITMSSNQNITANFSQR